MAVSSKLICKIVATPIPIPVRIFLIPDKLILKCGHKGPNITKILLMNKLKDLIIKVYNLEYVVLVHKFTVIGVTVQNRMKETD